MLSDLLLSRSSTYSLLDIQLTPPYLSDLLIPGSKTNSSQALHLRLLSFPTYSFPVIYSYPTYPILSSPTYSSSDLQPTYF